MNRHKGLERKSPLQRRGNPIKRQHGRPPMAGTEAKLALQFHDETLRYMPRCAVCGYEGPFLEAHHVLPQAVIRDELRAAGRETTVAVLWDVRNGMTLCAEPAPNRCHDRHTNATQRVPRSKLRQSHHEFVQELDRQTGDERFSVRLEQMYPPEAA